MKRRDSLKLIATVVAAPAAIAGCKSKDAEKEKPKPAESQFTIDRNPDELKYERELLGKEKFFTPHEMATITVLSDMIIPRDDVSGSASDAGVPDFIEFIVKDMPHYQTPLRGGLGWIDNQSLKRFGKLFKDCTEPERIQIVDDIAYPEIEYKDEKGNPVKKGTVKPGMDAGVNFFSLMRNLTATGFYTSQIGVTDIGYAGNLPTQWNGVPPDVLRQYKLAYSEKDLKDCISFDQNT